MENEIINKEIKLLKMHYVIHIILYIILYFIHLVIYKNIYWIFDSIFLMFKISLYFFVAILFVLIIIYFILLFIHLVEKSINIYIKISLAFFVISIINSLFCSIISCYNSTLFDSFYSDCPFNYNIDDISKMIIKYNKSRNEMKYFCSSRKCFNINNISNIYLCNFHEKDKYYASNPNEENNNRYPEINNYTEFCQNYTDFYYISKDKHKKYEFDYEFICPSKKDIIYNYALTYLFIFSNLFCTPILWFLEYYSFKILLSLLIEERNFNVSLKETNNTSKIDGNNSLSNNNQEQIFENKTEIIIVDNSNIEQIKKIEEEKNINNESSKDISKSENQLINNINNNNIFKIMNQKENIKNNDNK